MTLSSDLDPQHVGTLWLLHFTGHLPPAVAPRVPVTFLRAGPEDIQELALAMGHSDPSEIQQRFAAGKQCYIGRIDGKLATYGWVTFDAESIGELGLSIRLQPDEAYIWDCGTPPAYRGRHLYPALLTYILAELHQMGLRCVWVGADSDNIASQKGMVLAGFRPIVDFLLAHTSATTSRAWLRGSAGATEQEIQDAHYALFGTRREKGE